MAISNGQAGYTLTEMLAALLIVGLAMSGLVEGGFALSRLQAVSTARVRSFDARRRTQTAFGELLDGHEPFRSSDDQMEGELNAFRFRCGEAACGASLNASGAETMLRLATPTSADLPLGPVANPHFIYVGSKTTQEIWPPASSDPPQRLQSVQLVSGDGESAHALATAVLWRQEEAGCRFDPILKDCRARSP